MADKTYKLHYDRMVEDALRQVVREALAVTARQGLPGAHHFYITFRTRHPGADLARHLLERHPDEMTIVLQNQFWGLEVTDEWFEVTLSFNKVNERLHIPFSAVTAFADPSAKFGLQFNVDTALERPLFTPVADRPPLRDQGLADGEDGSGDDSPRGGAPGEGGGNVIALDAFRKK